MYMHIVAAMATSPSTQDSPAAPAAAPAAPPPALAVPAVRPRLWAILFVLCGALFLDALDVSMIGVALPVIRTDLHLNTSSLQWLVSAYVLGYGGLLLLGGRAADLLGRRRMLILSLGVFFFAPAVASVVENVTLIVVAQFLKGASAAFTAPAGLSTITTTFAEGRDRNRAL